MAMKCMTQMPVQPMEVPPSSSHFTRAAPWYARARVVQRRPTNAPWQDMT